MNLIKDPQNWLYPEPTPYRSGTLRVSPVHEIYFEESGNPLGKPTVFVHGGPGSGTEPKQRRFFDPRKYRIILFDQRGCGKSQPYASLEENTTWDLVEDMEKLRKHLKIEKWQVFGGSWGSTLALAYTETHPDKVTELILRGIFLLRKKEIDWFYQKGADAIFPDFWEEYLAAIPKEEQGDLVKAYYKRLTSPDKEVQSKAARTWSVWEGRTSKLIPDAGFIDHYADAEFALAFARIECHYFTHSGWFQPDDQLLKDAHRLKNIPGAIVQGRYDIVCPMDSAWALHKEWPEADFIVVPDAGHSAFENGICKALVSTTDKFAS